MLDDELLTLPQIADMLGVNPSTVRLWVSEERLPAHKAGGRKWLVRRGDLIAMLEDQPHVGHPKRPPVKPAPRDWSEVDLAGSVELLGGIR